MADNSQLYSMTCQQLNYILEFWENCPFLRKYNYLIWVSHTLGGFVIILGVIYFRRFVGGFVMILGVIYFRRFVNAILGLTKLFWKKRKQRWVSHSLGLPDDVGEEVEKLFYFQVFVVKEWANFSKVKRVTLMCSNLLRGKPTMSGRVSCLPFCLFQTDFFAPLMRSLFKVDVMGFKYF